MVTLLDFSGGERDPGREEEQKPTKALPPRLQSPSSILTYKQCPRKYFYRYIARLPAGKSIHLVRGSVTHKVLEEFYAKDLSSVPDSVFPIAAKVILHELFRKEWAGAREQLDELGLPASQLEMYYEETKVMVTNFFHYLLERLKRYEGLTLAQALDRFRPRVEIELRSEKEHVRGYADAVHEDGGRTYILDYKTSSKCEITPEYELQLSIYGMIFEELNKLPDEVGIFFLKHGQELRLPVTRAMVERARREVQDVHARTGSRNIEDYPLRPGPLCKWSTGQCEYYELCFGNRKLSDYAAEGLVQVGSGGGRGK